MTFATIKKVVLESTKGSFHSLLWERPMKTKKAYADMRIVKRSSAVVRFGVEYDNMKAVQQKRATGELPAVNAGLQWGEWKMYPYFITHKGNTYLRCATSKQNPTRTEYFLNGVKVDAETIKPMVLASEFSKSESQDVFTLNVDNILAIR